MEAIRITAEDATPVKLVDYDGTFTYKSGSRHGRAVLTFHTDESGDYHVAVGERTSSGEGTILVGPGFRTLLRRTIRRAIAVAAVGLITAVAVAVAVAVAIRRSRTRRQPAS